MFKDCVEKVSEFDNVIAIGINCVHPSLVKPLLKVAKKMTDKPLVCYPNSGEIWDAREGHRCWTNDTEGEAMPILDGSHAIEMQTNGATLIGGCCRVTADQIGEFNKALFSKNSRL